jgi:hypothetical protein
MKVGKLLALAAILCMVGVAMAQDAPKRERPKGIAGKIKSVDGMKLVITKRAREGQEATEVTVTADDKTVVTLDRKEATMADLKADMFVFVTPETGTAVKIMASTKMRERPKKPADAPKKEE